MNGQLDGEGLSSLRLLYAPLIGEEAVSLYQLLAVLAVSRRPITNHRLIVQLANMSIERFEQQRQILERHLLLKTFLDPKTNQYLYHILPVKSGNAFLRHEVFGRLYLRRMGKDTYEFAKLYFAEEHTDTKSYVELTASFSPDDPQWLQSSSDAFIRLRPSATQRAHPADGFDYERFLQGFERRFPPQLQTKEHLELIGELAQAHGIDALEMRKLVNQCINPRTKEFNVELLKKKARAKGRIIDDVPKDPYQASPVQFFRQLQPGIPISAAACSLQWPDHGFAEDPFWGYHFFWKYFHRAAPRFWQMQPGSLRELFFLFGYCTNKGFSHKQPFPRQLPDEAEDREDSGCGLWDLQNHVQRNAEDKAVQDAEGHR